MQEVCREGEEEGLCGTRARGKEKGKTRSKDEIVANFENLARRRASMEARAVEESLASLQPTSTLRALPFLLALMNSILSSPPRSCRLSVIFSS